MSSFLLCCLLRCFNSASFYVTILGVGYNCILLPSDCSYHFGRGEGRVVAGEGV